MNSLYNDVKVLALSLADGCTDSSSECPKCHSDKAFSVTRDGNQLKFICFRASCHFRGVIDSTTGKSMYNFEAPKKPVKLFTGELDFLTGVEIRYLSDKFLIKPELLQLIRWGVEDERVYFPQYTIQGKVHGYIARMYPDLTWMSNKGAKAYWKPVRATVPALLFPNMGVLAEVRKQKRVMLVEDYPSALRINSQLGIPCCCLGGTNLYDPVISSLIELGVEEVYIMLDADAVHKAVKMKAATALLFDVTIIPLMGPDPKDLSEEELKAVCLSVL